MKPTEAARLGALGRSVARGMVWLVDSAAPDCCAEAVGSEGAKDGPDITQEVIKALPE